MNTLLHPTPSDAGQRFEHDAMACTFGLCLFGVDRRYAEQAARAAFDEVDRLEQALSRFVPHSDIARLNAMGSASADSPPFQGGVGGGSGQLTAHPPVLAKQRAQGGAVFGSPIPVAIETIECLQLAAQLYDLTGGAFDVAFRTPGPRDVAPLVLDPAAHAVGVQVPGVQLDLGGLGKGYAVDRVVALLREWGVPAGRVHAGQSTVRVFGTPPGGGTWRVGLRHPERRDETLGVVMLWDAASPDSAAAGAEEGEHSDTRRLQPSPNPSRGVRASRPPGQPAHVGPPRPFPNPALEGKGVWAGALSGSGQRLHGGHIIDPRAAKAPRTDQTMPGRRPADVAPIAGAVQGAWAVAPSAALADGLSTAFMILSTGEIEAVCRRLANVTAILLPAGPSPTLQCCGAPCGVDRSEP